MKHYYDNWQYCRCRFYKKWVYRQPTTKEYSHGVKKVRVCTRCHHDKGYCCHLGNPGDYLMKDYDNNFRGT